MRHSFTAFFLKFLPVSSCRVHWLLLIILPLVTAGLWRMDRTIQSRDLPRRSRRQALHSNLAAQKRRICKRQKRRTAWRAGWVCSTKMPPRARGPPWTPPSSAWSGFCSCNLPRSPGRRSRRTEAGSPSQLPHFLSRSSVCVHMRELVFFFFFFFLRQSSGICMWL